MTDLSSGTIADALAGVKPKPNHVDRQAEAQRVLCATALVFGTGVENIKGDSQRGCLRDARSVAMTLVRSRAELSWEEIGDVFRRDRSTVTTAVRNVLGSPERLAWAAAVQAELDREETP